jgi:trans-L-3-hydroxyproline dehydratase
MNKSFQKIETIDMHTGGEPLRIIVSGFPELQDQSVLAARDTLKKEYDHLRKAVMWEPRGHRDMYGLIKIPAERPDSAFGVIFMHNEGYSTMCGHATIAIGKAAIELGWIKDIKEPNTTFKIDAPCGQLIVASSIHKGEVQQVSFENVPSFYVGSYNTPFEHFGEISYDLAYGGAFYAYADISQFGLDLSPDNSFDLISLGKRFKQHVIKTNSEIVHPEEKELSFLYGCIFRDGHQDADVHSQNVCIFADGELDRSPTGSGVSGRAAILHAKGTLQVNQEININSIIDSQMSVKIKRVIDYLGMKAVVPEVSGKAFFTGKHEFWIDPNDALGKGFLL